MEQLLITLLTSGVLATIIASIINLISIKKTNNRLFEIEKIKINNSVQTFRYSKLFELNSELNSLPSINYTYLKEKNGKLIQDEKLLVKVIEESSDRFSKLIKIYYKTRPLFDYKIIKRVEDLITQENNESNRIIKNLYGTEVEKGGNNTFNNLMNIRQELEIAFRNSIIKQLEDFIK